jgi:4-amino-4-deoxychorismate lyase
MEFIYYNGHMVPAEEAKIPFSDRGFQIGDGAFATIQVNEGTPLFLESHLLQLSKQCKNFNLIFPPLNKENIVEIIERNKAFHGIWRLKILVTGGDSEEIRLPQRSGRVIVFIKPFTPFPFKRLKMGIFSVPYSLCHASFKSLAHLNRFYVMEEAHRLGLDDAVTVTESGILLEAAFGNLFWVKEKTLYTCDSILPLYFGVTIKNAITLAQKLGFKIENIKWRLSDIPPGCLAFRTNTMQGIRPIGQIGNHFFAEHTPLQDLFVRGYETLVKEEKKSWEMFSSIPTT